MPKDSYTLPHDHGQDTRRVLERMPSRPRFERVATLFRLLEDPTRLRILWFLCHCSECVTDIGAVIGMSVAAVSHHLQVLRRAGILVSERRGKEIYYTLADTHDLATILLCAFSIVYLLTGTVTLLHNAARGDAPVRDEIDTTEETRDA